MIEKPRSIAVALLSGGLDSTLAARVILEQGIEVIGVNFAGAYCPRPRKGRSNAARAAEQLGIELVTLPIDTDFIAMVKRPKHGRGKNMNPCIDCHTLMIRKAWEYGQGRQTKSEVRSQKSEGRSEQAEGSRDRGIQEWSGGPKASCQSEVQDPRSGVFVITGEVLGQRPMSQNRQALAVVARESGTGDRLLRPMSAKLLDMTAPEREGLVVRERLLDIEGRQRTRQMALAEQYGIREYPNPAGGCLLTEKVFSRRLAEAFGHGEDELEVIELLSLGRHFRLPSGARLVVGRDEAENDELLRRAPAGSVIIDASDLPGPVGLAVPVGAPGALVVPSDRTLAARICARYSDKRREKRARVIAAGEAVDVEPATEEESARLLIG